MNALAAAVRFLTLIPMRGAEVAPGRAAAWFPLVGAMLGAAGAALFWGASRVVPVPLAALVTVAFWTLVSGVLHEDGLADVADAVRAGRTRERMLAILRDSRIGAFGAVMLVLSLLARWQALQYLATPNVWTALIAAQAVPRAAMVALAWISRPVGAGLGASLAATLTTGSAVFAIVQGVVAALATGWRPGLAMLAGCVAVLRVVQVWFYQRLGGVNGDCLGFTEQVLEIWVLVLFTCRSCAW